MAGGYVATKYWLTGENGSFWDVWAMIIKSTQLKKSIVYCFILDYIFKQQEKKG